MFFLIQIIFVTIILLAIPALLYFASRAMFPKICRRIAYEVHLWLGVVSGIILFVVCLSGTILTFKTEIIQLVERERYYIDESIYPRQKNIEELIAIIEKAEKCKVIRITIPDKINKTWIFNIKKESDKTKKLPAGMPATHAALGTAYIVNPFTGESLGPQRSKIYMFFMALTFLHRFLLLDIRTGQIIVGSATLIFLVIVITGLFLWLPSRIAVIKNWSQGLKIRSSKSRGAFLFDLHNTLGFYVLIPVVVMALTGPIISFKWYRTACEQALGAKTFRIALEKPLKSKNADPQKKRLAWDDFFEKGNKMTKHKGNTRLSIPQTQDGCVIFQRTGTGLCNIASIDKFQFDQYTGEILKADLFDELPFNEKIASLIFPLHNGEIFGVASKIIYFLACMIATTLPVTGVILWIRKLKKLHKKRNNKNSYNIKKQELLRQT
ncbi:MAG: PepSY domain-containing protein [Planctomycetaceae bacterium]|jgi:uncharacterized iron-regulated membrane protein|nr:PepSY domain-containing protein [Planctomycetaceae bacterium]